MGSFSTHISAQELQPKGDKSKKKLQQLLKGHHQHGQCNS